MYLTVAMLFNPLRRFRLQLYETDVSDVEMVHDTFSPHQRWDFEGPRVLVVA